MSGEGAYGLVVHGLPGAAPWMQPLPADSPALRVEVSVLTQDGERESRLDERRADLRLVDRGRLQMHRDEGVARFSFPTPPPDADVLHPYLAPAAALAHLWAGREALHGGAFATDAGAVVLLAGKEGGKSTTLAWLNAQRVPVLADDLVVLSDGSLLAGPRCLDLRAAGALMPAGVAGERSVRRAERIRLTLPPVRAATPLAASVVLRFGDRIAVEPVAPAERLGLLLPERMFAARVPADLSALLDVAARPMLALTRPRGEAGLREGIAALLGYLS